MVNLNSMEVNVNEYLPPQSCDQHRQINLPDKGFLKIDRVNAAPGVGILDHCKIIITDTGDDCQWIRKNHPFIYSLKRLDFGDLNF